MNDQITIFEPSTTASTVVVTSDSKAAKYSVDPEVAAAVMQYIRTLRGLGRTRVGTRDIADALNLPLRSVSAAVSLLRDQGVKSP